MQSMFYSAITFNQPIGNWNTSKVADMRNMFQSATGFNQPIGNWNISGVTQIGSFMSNKTSADYSADNLTDIYTGWTSGGKTVKPNLTINFGAAPTAIKYTAAGQAGKNLLTGSTVSGGYNWTIVDGGVS
jgi:surface protein